MVEHTFECPPPGRPRYEPGPGPVRLTRRGRVVLVLGAVALCLAAVSTGAATSASSPAEASVRVHVVRPGETLWAIARRLAPQQDPRAVIAEICDLNDDGCARLEAGRRLRVPVR